MKTSNKLLLGLIIVIMLLAVITVDMTHQHSESIEYKQYNEEEASIEHNLSQNNMIVSAVLFSPIIFLQLPR